MTQKDSHMVAVATMKPTQSSLACSIEGIITDRPGSRSGPGLAPGGTVDCLVAPYICPVSTIDSRIDTSRSSPSPVCTVRCHEVSPPTAAKRPPNHSAGLPPICAGGRSGEPRLKTEPAHACSVKSLAGASAHGPSRPNGVIATTMACGARRSSSWGANSGRSARRDPRVHTMMLALCTRAVTSSRSARASGSATTLRFEHARNSNRGPSTSGSSRAPMAQCRNESPSGGSTLITSAPPSANALVQYPPATPSDRSTTRRPSSGGVRASGGAVLVEVVEIPGIQLGDLMGLVIGDIGKCLFEKLPTVREIRVVVGKIGFPHQLVDPDQMTVGDGVPVHDHAHPEVLCEDL